MTHRSLQHDISHHGGYRMSYPKLTDQTAAVTAALAELDAHPADRVLIMLPDGPGFAGAIQQGVVPLPVDPLLPAHDVITVAAEAGAHVVLASADQSPALPSWTPNHRYSSMDHPGSGPPRCDCAKRRVRRHCGIPERRPTA
jgi:acyl-CoA synthetase (AMP-forming)/AMP-acid ligase II